MQFRTPQFIDVEDKIFGPFTWKQFLYLVGGVGICFVLYKILPIYLAIPLMLPAAGLALALTFVRINEKPFIDILQSYISFSMQNRLYIWKKEPKKIDPKKEKVSAEAIVPRMTESKLRDISWSLDVLDRKEENNYGGKS